MVHDVGRAKETRRVEAIAGETREAEVRMNAASAVASYHNPIFVDVDGNGFEPNGDTLGFDLPAGKLTVEQAKVILAATGH